jgi:hypothetical protein
MVTASNQSINQSIIDQFVSNQPAAGRTTHHGLKLACFVFPNLRILFRLLGFHSQLDKEIDAKKKEVCDERMRIMNVWTIFLSPYHSPVEVPQSYLATVAVPFHVATWSRCFAFERLLPACFNIINYLSTHHSI